MGPILKLFAPGLKMSKNWQIDEYVFFFRPFSNVYPTSSNTGVGWESWSRDVRWSADTCSFESPDSVISTEI